MSTAYSHRVNTIDGASGGTIDGEVKASKGSFGFDVINTGTYSFVAGDSNSVVGDWATIGGGKDNRALEEYSTVGGGKHNWADEAYCTIGGGFDNQAFISSYATVGGGRGNDAKAIYATISGGLNNTASSNVATVCGGNGNIASGGGATVCGGVFNTATFDYSFAAGRRAKASHQGAFVWADSYDGDFASSTSNEFNIRASGGVRIYTNTSLTAGVTLSSGGSSWNSVSDSTLKRNIHEVNGKEILQKLMLLPIKQWSYKSQDPSIEHIGPMAQDFYSIFGIGENETTISTIDPSGIALVAIQELYQVTQKLEKKTEELEKIKIKLSSLEEKIEKILAQQGKQQVDKAYSLNDNHVQEEY